MRPTCAIRCISTLTLFQCTSADTGTDVRRGGLGLTGGLSDIGSLADCFYGILDGQTDDSILDKWDEVRRKIYKEYIDPLSTTNLQRLLKDPAEVRANDPFFKVMDQAAKDPGLAEELHMVSERKTKSGAYS